MLIRKDTKRLEPELKHVVLEIHPCGCLRELEVPAVTRCLHIPVECHGERRVAVFELVEWCRACHKEDWCPRHDGKGQDVYREAVIKAPPFKEHFADGEKAAYYPEQTTEEYRFSRAAGSCWDEETYMESLPPDARARLEARAAKKVVQRYDATKMQRFVERYPHRVSTREKQVYALFYASGWGRGAIARELGVATKTVENTLLNLRKKMREHSRHPRGKLAEGSSTP